MSTLEPRSLPPSAYKGWLKNGARIVARSWDVWVPLMFVLSCLANVLAQAWPWFFLVLLAFSGVVHGLNGAAAERYARKERFGWMGLIACWATEMQAFGPVFRRSVIVRGITTAVIVLGVFALQVTHGVATHEAQAATATPTPVSAPLPMWFLFFTPWNNVWFFSLLLQAGGPISMHYWLITRCGVTPAEASRLFNQAFRQNFPGFCHLIAIAVILLIVASLLPFLTVPLECFWVAVMFCAWNEVFMGKAELEKQVALAHLPVIATAAG